MSIEQNIERIATALESLAAGAVDLGVVINSAAAIDAAAESGETITPPAETAPDPTPPKRKPRKQKSTVAVTVENVREAAQIFLKDDDAEGTKMAQARAILGELGSESITALDPKHYAAAVASFTV